MVGERGVKYPFEVGPKELLQNLDRYVTATIESLGSYYLVIPKGDNFVEYVEFEHAYRVLSRKTKQFSEFTFERVREAVTEDSLVFVVFRCILGFSPPELAHLTTEQTGVGITQGFARSIDQRARARRPLFRRSKGQIEARLEAMLRVACEAITTGAPPTPITALHRLAKVDTERGMSSLQRLAKKGVQYPTLLYERFLGRPFASHRDAISERVGDIIEAEINRQLREHGVPFHKTGRAERIPGFDQAPDFLIPSAEDPKVVIEAKLSEDDGTARDKVTRVQHLRELADRGRGFEVIACIDGRGFSIRHQDMRKPLRATKGKVFTMATLVRLIETTSLKELRAPAVPNT